ncbi:MAG TPA: ATP-binding protein [Acidobacteriota bacterium]|nr:ATP-binding protein [Acidobacteriota bacterium]
MKPRSGRQERIVESSNGDTKGSVEAPFTDEGGNPSGRPDQDIGDAWTTSSRSLGRLLKKGAKVSGNRMLALLAVLLVSINLLGIWGILYSGREAQQAVIKDLQLQAVAGAKSLEAILASTRADFLFLAKSPPIVGFQQALESADPMARRWKRLDIEATLLLFLTSHPEIERISLLQGGTSIIVAGHREGAPVILPSDSREAQPNSERVFVARWELGDPDSQTHMEALVSTDQLLELADPTGEYSLALQPSSKTADSQGSLPDESTVIVPVSDSDWSPPIEWEIMRSERRAGLLASLGRLTGRFQMTLVVTVLLLLLATALGILSVRQARRSIALEIENRQQAQIRELERQLMHSERLASVGRLTAGLAHEINNPLEGMSNYLALLEDDIKSGSLDTSLEFVEKVREGLTRAAGVTRRALTFAEPGRKPDTLIDLRQVVQDTVQFVKSNRLFRDIDVRVNHLDLNPTVLGNPVTLGQAFLNLLLNAAEIQGDSGKIEIDFSIEDELVQVTVADSGPGIDEDVLPKIFDPFFSGRGSTGLGLSICRSIIERHEGGISAANRPEGGAVFSVSIPLADAVSSSSAREISAFSTLD